MKIKKLLIIDGSNYLHRQLHQPELWELQYNGKRTGGVYGFLRSLTLSIQQFPDYYPVVVFDYGKSLRRLSIYPNYKRTEDMKLEREERKKALAQGLTVDTSGDEYLDELIRQGNIIIDLLRTLRIPTIKMYHWEGDDLIKLLTQYGDDIVISTDDKDMYQLINSTTRVYRAMRNDDYGNRGQIVDINKLLSDYKSTREYVIVKSILGDGSDNIPKVADRVGYVKANEIAQVIIENNEDPNKYLPKLQSMGKHYTKFFDNHEQYIINLNLIDLSLVPNDPIVLENLNMELNNTSTTPNYIEVAQVLASVGISNIDYPELINCVYHSRLHNIEGDK